MAQELIKGPGILYVSSKIVRSDILDEATFLRWYDEEHIPEVVRMGGIKSGRRYINVQAAEADWPHLVMYSLDDISFTGDEELEKLHIASDALPGGTGSVLDLTEFEMRHDYLVQVYDPTNKGKGCTKTLITAEVELKDDDGMAQEFDRWYRQEHLPLIAKCPGYLRTTRFRLVAATGNSKPEKRPPLWSALHEFEAETVDLALLRQQTATEWANRMRDGYAESRFNVWRLEKEAGEGDWFYGEEA